jgi:hypothetical protein
MIYCGLRATSRQRGRKETWQCKGYFSMATDAAKGDLFSTYTYLLQFHGYFRFLLGHRMNGDADCKQNHGTLGSMGSNMWLRRRVLQGCRLLTYAVWILKSISFEYDAVNQKCSWKEQLKCKTSKPRSKQHIGCFVRNTATSVDR